MTKAEALLWIADVFDEPPGSIAETTRRSEILGWDSLGVLSLMAALDERFEIQLTEDELGKLQRIDDILNLLRQHDALVA